MTSFPLNLAAKIKTILPIIENYKHRFEMDKAIPHDYKQFRRAYNQIKILFENEFFEEFVGGLPDEQQEEYDNEIYERVTSNLLIYLAGIVILQEYEDKMNELIKENRELRKQVDESNKRENTYISIIRHGDILDNVNQDSKTILLESLKRQKIIYSKNLARSEETKAKYGISTPLDILNTIDDIRLEMDNITEKINELQG